MLISILKDGEENVLSFAIFAIFLAILKFCLDKIFILDHNLKGNGR